MKRHPPDLNLERIETTYGLDQPIIINPPISWVVNGPDVRMDRVSPKSTDIYQIKTSEQYQNYDETTYHSGPSYKKDLSIKSKVMGSQEISNARSDPKPFTDSPQTGKFSSPDRSTAKKQEPLTPSEGSMESKQNSISLSVSFRQRMGVEPVKSSSQHIDHERMDQKKDRVSNLKGRNQFPAANTYSSPQEGNISDTRKTDSSSEVMGSLGRTSAPGFGHASRMKNASILPKETSTDRASIPTHRNLAQKIEELSEKSRRRADRLKRLAAIRSSFSRPTAINQENPANNTQNSNIGHNSIINLNLTLSSARFANPFESHLSKTPEMQSQKDALEKHKTEGLLESTSTNPIKASSSLPIKLLGPENLFIPKKEVNASDLSFTPNQELLAQCKSHLNFTTSHSNNFRFQKLK